jgi:plasmid maintenance system antidote protein VapI|nr:MAG TPA: helix-turn-helix protein [Caudoviricetes sp.]
MILDIKKFAFDMQLKQQDLSEVIGVAQSQISAMMNGKREIKEEHIERLKAKYGDIISRYIIQQQTGATQNDNTITNSTNTQEMDPLAMALDYISTLKQQLVEKDELIRRLTAGQQTAADEVLSRRVGAVEKKQDELTENL